MTITQLVREISPRLLHAAGRYRGRAIDDIRQILPRPTPVAKATKFVIKTAIGLYTRYIRDHCIQQGGFGVKLSNDVNQKFTRTDLGCHGNEIRDKIGNNSACAENIVEILAPNRCFFGVGLMNGISQILLATKFNTK